MELFADIVTMAKRWPHDEEEIAVKNLCLLPLLGVALTIAGCQRAAPQEQPVAATAPAGDYLARFRSLSEAQRNGVLLRAIRDAGHDCQGVGESVASGSVDGAPAWTATCTDRAQWVVVMTERGTATVVNAAALRGAQAN